MVAYMRFETLRALRNPRFLVLVGIVPVALYLVGLHGLSGRTGAIEGLPLSVWLLASSAVLGCVAAALNGAGARLAAERAAGWTRQLRVTPLSDVAWLAGRVLSSVVVIIPVIAVVALLSITVGHVDLAPARWVQLLVTLLLGAVPIALIGLVIGLAFRAEAAQAGQAVIFLVLAFVGGAFANSSTPPPGVGVISHIAPSFYLVNAARAATRGEAPAGADVLGLLGTALLLAVAVAWLRRRAL